MGHVTRTDLCEVTSSKWSLLVDDKIPLVEEFMIRKKRLRKTNHIFI